MSSFLRDHIAYVYTACVKSANLGEQVSKLRLPEVRRPSGGNSAPPGQPQAPVDAEDTRLQRLERLAELHQKGRPHR